MPTESLRNCADKRPLYSYTSKNNKHLLLFRSFGDYQAETTTSSEWNTLKLYRDGLFYPLLLDPFNFFFFHITWNDRVLLFTLDVISNTLCRAHLLLDFYFHAVHCHSSSMKLQHFKGCEATHSIDLRHLPQNWSYYLANNVFLNSLEQNLHGKCCSWKSMLNK